MLFLVLPNPLFDMLKNKHTHTLLVLLLFRNNNSSIDTKKQITFLTTATTTTTTAAVCFSSIILTFRRVRRTRILVQNEARFVRHIYIHNNRLRLVLFENSRLVALPYTRTTHINSCASLIFMCFCLVSYACNGCYARSKERRNALVANRRMRVFQIQFSAYSSTAYFAM